MNIKLSLGAAAAVAAGTIGFVALQPRAAQAETPKQAFAKMQRAYTQAKAEKGHAIQIRLVGQGVPDQLKTWEFKDGHLVNGDMKVVSKANGQITIQLANVEELHQGDGHKIKINVEHKGGPGAIHMMQMGGDATSISISDINGKKTVTIMKGGKKLEEKDMSPELRKAVQSGDFKAISKALGMPEVPVPPAAGMHKIMIPDGGKGSVELRAIPGGKSFSIQKSITKGPDGKTDELNIYEVDGVKVDEQTLKDQMKKFGMQPDSFVVPDIDNLMNGKGHFEVHGGDGPHVILVSPETSKSGESIRFRVVRDPKSNLPASVVKERLVNGKWVAGGGASIQLAPVKIELKTVKA